MKKLLIFLIVLNLIQVFAQEPDLSRFDKVAIKNTLMKNNMPKTLVISGKYFDAQYIDSKIMEVAINRINEYFQKLGIPYVSYNSTKDLMENYGQSQNYLDIAMKANTTNYIVVNLVKNELGKLNNYGYYSTIKLTLDAYDTENGLGIGSFSGSSEMTGSSVSQEEATYLAVRQVASLGAEEIITQIIDHLNDTSGVYYEIRLFGVKDLVEAQAFKKILTELTEFTGSIRISNGTDGNWGDYYRYEITYNCKRPDLIVDKILEKAIQPESILRKIDKCSDPGKLINFCLPR